MKKKIILFIVLIICVVLSASFASGIRLGVGMDGIIWVYDGKKELHFNKTIFSRGYMNNYEVGEYFPKASWWKYAENVEKVVFDDKIIHIGANCLHEFKDVQEIDLPIKLESIGYCAFERCVSLKQISFPDNLHTISADAFYCCKKLENISWNDEIKKIEDTAFGCCYALKEVDLPDSIEEMGFNCFASCTDLRRISLPEKLRKVQWATLAGCKKITHINLPPNIQAIEHAAFVGTSIEEIVIPSSVEEIPNDGISFSRGIFTDCKKLKRVRFDTVKLKHMYRTALKDVNEDCIIEVPKSKYEEYKKKFQKAGLSKKVKIIAI